jgi:tetratricopeptide (TPR) repeat protein
MSRRGTVIVALLLVAGPASAQRELREAKQHHDLGIKEYNIGHFDAAIAEFEKAYELDPDPVLLYNVAQAHRQKGDPERAIFFYRRYLQMSPSAPDREQVRAKIADLERAREAQRPRPEPSAPAPLPPPSGPLVPPPTATPVLPEPVVTAEGRPESDEEGPALRITVAGGAALPLFSGRDLELALVGSVRAAALCALPAGDGVLDLGLAGSLVTIPYERVDRTDGAQFYSYLFGVAAVAGYRAPLGPRFSLGAEADAGVGLWTGLEPGNPFTRQHRAAPGLHAMPAFRLAAMALFRVGRPLWFWAGPAYQLAVPVGADFKEGVSAVHLLELAGGIALQL